MGKLQDADRKRIFLPIGFAVLLIAAFAVFGCSSSATSSYSPQKTNSISSRQASAGPLKVAVQYNALSIPTVFADDKGYFTELGMEVDIFTFVNGAEENQALESGEVDLASDGLASVYMLATGNFSWIGESDEGSSTVAVYMNEQAAPTKVKGQLKDNPNILGSADTLRGLTVVGPAGTMEEWTAISYFSQFGLEEGKDFDFVEMDRVSASESVINGKADVFIATDADYCRLMEENGLVAVATGAEATRVPFNNGYIVNNKILETRYNELVSFLIAVYKAAEILDNDPKMANEFTYEYYRANGKPATLEDVEYESKIRAPLVPADFKSPDYRLGSGVLRVGEFNAEIGALEFSQVENIANSINPKLLEDAFDITVKAATIDDTGD